jgi:hypothetical protein
MWPGLLAWSAKYHDGTKPSEFKMMSDEDKAFLEKAMEEAMSQIEDPNKMFSEAIGMVKATDRTDESITTALEVIDRCCDDPDVARNAEKLDGIQPTLDLLQSHPGPICNRALEILALLFANNENLQEAGGRRGSMEIFLRLVRESDAGSETRSKAFRALVALVRANQAFEEGFLKENDGINVIKSCMDPSDLRLCEKATSFARSLAEADRLQADDVEKLIDAMTPLVSTIGSGQIQYRETLSSCAAQLVKRYPKDAPAALTSAAENRLKELDQIKDDSNDNERDNLKELLSWKNLE